MRTDVALSAAMLLASAASRDGGPQTVLLDGSGNKLAVLSSHEFAILRETANDRSYVPLLSVYPGGRVDLYNFTNLPAEVSDVY